MTGLARTGYSGCISRHQLSLTREGGHQQQVSEDTPAPAPRERTLLRHILTLSEPGCVRLNVSLCKLGNFSRNATHIFLWKLNHWRLNFCRIVKIAKFLDTVEFMLFISQFCILQSHINASLPAVPLAPLPSPGCCLAIVHLTGISGL